MAWPARGARRGLTHSHVARQDAFLRHGVRRARQAAVLEAPRRAQARNGLYAGGNARGAEDEGLQRAAGHPQRALSFSSSSSRYVLLYHALELPQLLSLAGAARSARARLLHNYAPVRLEGSPLP